MIDAPGHYYLQPLTQYCYGPHAVLMQNEGTIERGEGGGDRQESARYAWKIGTT